MSKYISGIKNPAFSVDTNGILSTSTTISGTNTIPGVSIGLNTSAIATLELTSSSSSGQSYIDFTHINQDYGGRILYDHSLNELALFTNANASAEVYINNLGNMGIGGRSTTYPLEINGHVQAKNGSFRTTGATGWYNDTYGSGWYMVDNTAVRVFADKHIATAGNIYVTNVNPTGVINLLNNHGINFQTNSTANKINFDPATNLLVYDTSAIHNFYINTVLQTSISTLGITIPNGNALYTTNIDSNTQNVAVGYYTIKSTQGVPTFNVYNNSINRAVLFAVNSGGTSGGNDNVTINPLLFVNNAINITNASGVENLIQNLSVASASPLNLYMPNLSIGNFSAFRVGISSSLNNAAELRFLNVGSQSVLNSVSVAFYGNNNMYTITASGIHTFAGTNATYQIPLILKSTLSCTTINTNSNTITAGQINSGNISTTGGIHVSSYLAPNNQGGTYSWNRDTNSGYTCFTNQQGAGSGGYEFLHCDSSFNIMPGKFVMDSIGNAYTTSTFTCNTLHAATAGINNASPQYTLDVTGDIMARGAFLRTTGNTGWYNDTYAGGWYMVDTTAVRVYGDKNIATAGSLFGQNLILTGNLAISTVTATENYIKNMSTTTGSVLNMTMPNLVNGSSSLFRIGANTNGYNCAEIRFLYNSSGNTSNAYGIGFFGYNNLYNLTASGAHSFTGTSASFSVPLNTNDNNITCGNGNLTASIINATTNMNTPSIHVNSFVAPNVQGGTYAWNRTGSGGLTCFTNQQGTGTGGYEFLHYDSSFNLLPGRFTMDNSGNATLTGQLNCASLFASNGTGATENLMQNQAVTPGSILNLMMPNLGINNYTLLRNGVSITANNCAEFRFIYAGSGNAANTGCLGFFGSQPIYTYTVAGIHTFTGSSVIFNVPITTGSIFSGSISCHDINTNGYDITCINNGTVTASNISVVNLSVTGIFNISSISCHDINTNGYNISCGGGIVSANSILCNGLNTQNNRINCGPITCYDIDTQNNGINCGGLNTNNINCTTINTNGYSTFGGGYAPNLWASAYCNGPGIASTGGTGSTKLCAIFYESLLFAGGWFVRSDSRIKTDIATITNAAEILNTINPCTYMHIDKKKCDVKKYGLIAQEVEKIIPEAINISSDIIPNVMKLAKKISIRSFELDQDLHIGLIRLYISNEGNSESKLDCSIISKSKYIYTVDADITKDIVFVYGEFVDDLKSIDYNAFISILIAGYKTQATEIKKQDARIKRLEELLLSI